MHGKVCLITGANRGIGKVTALELARLGAEVVMVSRDRELGAAARNKIIDATGNPAVELLVADLASMAQVRHLADTFLANHDQLHVLVNNAGLAKHDRVLTEDGYETTLAVNHLAPFLLTHLLLNVLKTSAPARIVNVSSMMHQWGTIHFDDLMGEQHYNMHSAYSQSKLASVLFTCELARQLDGTGVTANCVHPGTVRTDMFREYTGFMGLMTNHLWRPFMKSPDKGAATSLYLATSSKLDGITGKYFANCREKRPSRSSRNKDLARQLWEVSQELVDRS
ncbi:MAG: SDR family oxidoreductase [Fidelibacterota bacterium]|nr:MAG: SDR family oxidoreductase [Candidatus Neomarinimicrobiota bacterium]